MIWSVLLRPTYFRPEKGGQRFWTPCSIRKVCGSMTCHHSSIRTGCPNPHQCLVGNAYSSTFTASKWFQLEYLLVKAVKFVLWLNSSFTLRVEVWNFWKFWPWHKKLSQANLQVDATLTQEASIFWIILKYKRIFAKYNRNTKLMLQRSQVKAKPQN